jgi:hypothetical protein
MSSTVVDNGRGTRRDIGSRRADFGSNRRAVVGNDGNVRSSRHDRSPGLITVCRLAVSALLLSTIAMIRRGKARRPAAPGMAVAAMAAYYVFAMEAFTRAPVVEVTLYGSKACRKCFLKILILRENIFQPGAAVRRLERERLIEQ